MSRLALVPVLLVLAGCTDTPTTPKAGTTSGTAAAARPRPDKEGQSWTLNELVNYLRSAGVGEDVFLRDEGGSGAGYTSVRLYTKKPEGADPRLTNIGFILRYENAETARLNAGSSATKTLWGKFVLEFDDYNPKATARARDEIKKALGL